MSPNEDGPILSRRALIGLALSIAQINCKRRTSLTFGQLLAADGAIPYLAIQSGVYERVGLKVLSVDATGGMVVSNQLAASTGGIDLGIMSTPPLLASLSQGKDFRVLATTNVSRNTCSLLSRAPITPTSVLGDLRGKRLGYTKNTVSQVFLLMLMERERLSLSDFNAVVGAPPEIATLLGRGSLDAAVLWDPFLHQALRLAKTNVVGQSSAPALHWYSLPGLQTTSNHLVSRPPLIAAKREEMKLFLKGLLETESAVSQAPQISQRRIEGWQNLGPGDLDTFWTNSSFRVHFSRTELEDSMRSDWKYLLGTAFPKDFANKYDDSLLREVDANRVDRIA